MHWSTEVYIILANFEWVPVQDRAHYTTSLEYNSTMVDDDTMLYLERRKTSSSPFFNNLDFIYLVLKA